MEFLGRNYYIIQIPDLEYNWDETRKEILKKKLIKQDDAYA